MSKSDTQAERSQRLPNGEALPDSHLLRDIPQGTLPLVGLPVL
ncbi:MAG: hypothetical protein ACO3EZ_09790 [Prochlorotrichaceae cyanobacterium]